MSAAILAVPFSFASWVEVVTVKVEKSVEIDKCDVK